MQEKNALIAQSFVTAAVWAMPTILRSSAEAKANAGNPDEAMSLLNDRMSRFRFEVDLSMFESGGGAR